jgi:hypothetical protein
MRASYVLGIAVTAAAMGAVGGSGVASADNEYSGQTYAHAQQAITNAGLTSRVGSVVGDQLPTDQCMVAESRTVPAIGSSGATGSNIVVLDLDCTNSAPTTSAPTSQSQPGQ